jgi:hypothetical protein
MYDIISLQLTFVRCTVDLPHPLLPVYQQPLHPHLFSSLEVVSMSCGRMEVV